MKSKRKTPDIRFRGFTDDWEQRKLGETSTLFDYGLNSSSMPYDGINKYLRITDIDDRSRRFKSEDLTSPSVGLENMESYLLEPGDLLFARTGATVGKSYLYSISDGKVYFAGYLIRTRILENYHPSFIFYNTLTDDYNKFVVVTSQRSGQPGINAEEFASFKLNVPSFSEQSKIGLFLNELDNTITLHQRKLQQLKEVKRGMLLKILPSYKNMNPSIRFNEDFDWRNEKLEFLITKNSEKNKELLINYVESISNKTGFTSQILQFEDYSVASKNLSNYYIIREKCFAYNPSRINVGSIAYKHKGDQSSVVSPLYVSFYTNQSLEDLYLWYWLKGQEFDRQREVYSEGGVRDTLSYNQLKEIKISYPDKKEQKLIGSLFEKLDRMIELQESEIELLEETKKGFLQKMFV